jgi:hemolysin D
MELIIKYFDTIKAAWNAREKQDVQIQRTRQELAFLPAVLEIQETPPHPLSRKIIYTLISFFLIVLVWGILGKIDIVSVAQGKIISSGHDKVVQPLATATVVALYVQEGQKVKQGELLVEFDSTINQAQYAKLLQEYQNSLLNRIMWESYYLILQGKLVPDHEKELQGLDKQRIVQEQQELMIKYQGYLAQCKSIRSETQQKQAELNIVYSEIQKLKKIIPIVDRRIDGLKKLSQEKYISDEQFEKVKEQQIENSYSLVSANHRVKELSAAIEVSRQKLVIYQHDTKSKIIEEIQLNKQQEKNLQKELVKIKLQKKQQKLFASISGTIHQLSVHTIGAVVTPAQQLMLIVPDNARLEIEAWVENRDIGFVNEKQNAEIKIETFPFTQYGVINGSIDYLSMDAVNNENKGLLFLARVAMDKDWIQVQDKKVNLQPGMNVTVEMKTGKRRIIEYFLSPLLRYKQESIRER